PFCRTTASTATLLFTSIVYPACPTIDRVNPRIGENPGVLRFSVVAWPAYPPTNDHSPASRSTCTTHSTYSSACAFVDVKYAASPFSVTGPTGAAASPPYIRICG